MNKFSIKIDLSTFFEDERKMVLLMVDPETWSQVKCLQKRVETLFDVDECRFLYDGFFIPPEEPIEILRFCKELTAFVPKESLNKRKRKKSKQARASDDCQNDIDANDDDHIEVHEDETKKKRKYRSLGSSEFASSTPNNNKRVKNCIESVAPTTIKHQDSRINKSSEISSTSSEQMPPPHPTSSSKDKKRKASKKEASSDSTDDVSTDNSTSASSSKGKKRKSSRKDVSVNDISVHNSNSPSKDKKRKTSMKEVSSDSTGDLTENTIVVSRKNSVADDISRTTKGKKSSVSNEDYCRKNDPSTAQISEITKQSLEDNSIEISKPTARISTLPSSTFINESGKSQKKSKRSNNPFRNQSTNLQHIHFNESGEISTTTTNNIQNKENEKSIPKVIYQCVLNERDAKKPRIFHITSSGGDNNDMATNNGKKPLIEIRENIIITPILGLNKTLDLETDQKETSNEGADTSSAFSNRPDNTTKEGDQSIEDNSLTDETNNSHTIIVKCTEKTMIGSVLKNNETDNNCTTTITDKNITDQSETEISVNLTTNENESSILSVDSHLDCVDLSVDVDEEDVIRNKNNISKSKTSKNVQDISISDTSDVEEVIDLNETDDQNTTTSSSLIQRSRSSINSIKVNRIIAWCKEAKEVPDVGDIMIFKIPFTNRKGNPDCTKFLAGKIERIQQRTKSIKFQILDGHSELFYVPDKYLDKYNDNSLCEEKYVQIKFSEIIQPRILPNDKMSSL